MAFEAVALEGGSVEDRMAFLTEAERERVEARFQRMIESGKTRAEVLELYRKIEVEGAKAYDLTLVKEKVEGSSAKLVYGMKRKDGKKDDASKQTVSLKREGGEWRIDEVVISLD